jgi:3-methyladenine DNA glycosylase AlkD
MIAQGTRGSRRAGRASLGSMVLDAAREARRFEARYRELGREERAAAEKRYLKSEIDHIGVDVKGLRGEIATFHKEHPALERAELLALARELWGSRWHELRATAIGLLEARVDLLAAKDAALVEQMIREGASWAYVDWLSIRVAGPLASRHAAVRERLDRWSRHDDLWLRRASLLALLLELRAGRGDFERFARYAAPMLHEQEFFVRKAIGWVLREISKRRPELTIAFVERHLGELSGLSLREGVRRLPAPVRDDLLARSRRRPRS